MERTMTNTKHKSVTPILVTGAERTGTTWVGHMLTASGEAAYISETFNVFDRRIWMYPAVQRWCTYICHENEGQYLPAMQNIQRFRYPLWTAARSIHSRKDIRDIFFDWAEFFRGRLFHKRLLMKDPSAIFSAPWLTKHLGFDVVVTIRHPLAFVSSRKRLNWPIRFNDWLDQPLLVQDVIGPYYDEIKRVQQDAQSGKADVIDLASMYWRIIYQVVARYREQYPQFVFVRHEDLSLQPVRGYREMYARLGLTFTCRSEKEIVESSGAKNPKEVSKQRPYAIRLDSRTNLDNWRQRLSADEIRRIRNLTEDVAALYYSDMEWE